jgi:hypothetical protein
MFDALLHHRRRHRVVGASGVGRSLNTATIAHGSCSASGRVQDGHQREYNHYNTPVPLHLSAACLLLLVGSRDAGGRCRMKRELSTLPDHRGPLAGSLLGGLGLGCCSSSSSKTANVRPLCPPSPVHRHNSYRRPKSDGVSDQLLFSSEAAPADRRVFGKRPQTQEEVVMLMLLVSSL